MSNKKTLSAGVERALLHFGNAVGQELIQASDRLIGENALVAVADRTEIVAGLRSMLAEVEYGQSSIRLRCLARLWHMTAQAPLNRLRKEFTDRLSPLSSDFEPLITLDDPNDRRYAAEALDQLAGPWLKSYAANSIVEEEAGERARAAMAIALLRHSEDLNEAISLLALEGRKLTISSKDPTASRVRRLIRIIEALMPAIIEIDPDVSEGIGRSVSDLVSNFLRYDRPTDPSVANDVAISVFRMARTIIRFHGTLAAEAGTFDFVPTVRKLFAGTEWPSELRNEIGGLARTVREALMFLAGKSVAADDLRRVHIALLGEAEARLILKKEVAAETGLTPEIASWLLSGRLNRPVLDSVALEGTILTQLDEDLARAYLEVVGLLPQIDMVETDLVAEARMISPAFGDSAERVFAKTKRIFRRIRNIADKRELRLAGHPGELTAFSPREHQTVDGLPATRTVRVRTQRVERVRPNGTIDVIVKSDVEQIQDQ